MINQDSDAHLNMLKSAARKGWQSLSLQDLDSLAEWHEEARIRAAIRRQQAQILAAGPTAAAE